MQRGCYHSCSFALDTCPHPKTFRISKRDPTQRAVTTAVPLLWIRVLIRKRSVLVREIPRKGLLPQLFLCSGYVSSSENVPFPEGH